MERIAILDGGREVSHLAVRFDAPAAAAPLCLLYLHGFGSDQAGEKADFFRRSALSAGLAFCSFDFQGHGASGGTMRELTLTRNLTDVARVHAFLIERGQSRIALVGSSMGGGTALWYAHAHPEAIVAGLHIAPALDLGGALLAGVGPQRARAWEETGVLAFHNDLVTCDLGWGLIEDLRRYRRDDLLAGYRTPTLLLHGQRDDTVPWRDTVDFADRARGRDLELHLFADGDHRLTDRKEQLWQLMLLFLRRRGLVPPTLAA